MIQAWFKAFLLTCLIEVPFVAWLLRRDDDDLPRRVGLLISVNWRRTRRYGSCSRYLISARLALGLSEAWAVSLKRCLSGSLSEESDPFAPRISSLANGVSFGIGLIVYQVAASLLS
ncbi:MAG: hypothetical protein U0165_18265 [Polyangiaceae bacterium]